MQPVLVCIWLFEKRGHLGSVEVEDAEKVGAFAPLPFASRRSLLQKSKKTQSSVTKGRISRNPTSLTSVVGLCLRFCGELIEHKQPSTLFHSIC